ncbi:hypothetical protein GKZ90_0001125 [Flavobacterium sp. MC2016-06]|jgi:hypothetical protein|uniref:hypothetical protein n=1 Tax=Flavobacterium sp. MC2016-06 TaxID=2676308 RepID=UPI0012BA6A46|nr:hypothetical protein [Flavobacterium sp. MC2016-06]MBU3859087.1 hypothetical protein [Flavobacterium sp. MC2016-06]
MVNFLKHLENPQINHEKIYEVMSDFRKGGLHPEMYNDFLNAINDLPIIRLRGPYGYDVFKKFNLFDITTEESMVIMKEVIRRATEDSKFCWHVNASDNTCKVDSKGKIVVSAAHSIQNNGILSAISENHEVTTYRFQQGNLKQKVIKKKIASIFWGFCNTHDGIFNAIENDQYKKTEEQNFLFAYRSFVVASHKKMEVSTFMNFGGLAQNDIIENRKIFDKAILEKDYSVIKSDIFELPFFYPIATSSSFYLDFDFNGVEIPHSDNRMENIFITLLPVLKDNKTYFILSYLRQDAHLYEKIGKQIKDRKKLKSDITILIGAHAENIYFQPLYYITFIEKFEEDLHKLIFQTQMDHGVVNMNNGINHSFSYTPSNYLQNHFNINFFGY